MSKHYFRDKKELIMGFAKKKHWIWFALLTAIYIVVTGSFFVLSSRGLGVFFHRFELLTLVYLFAIMHCILDIKSMYDWIYKYRVWIALGLFVFSVLNCFTLSSAGMYGTYIQPDIVSEYEKPIFGQLRAIRSDEWLVSLSRIIAGSYNHYGATNEIVRGTLTSGVSATGGFYFDYSALRFPASWGYYLFGAAYGSSFYFSYELIFGALLTFELCMILTKGKKLYSVFGAVIIWFSTFNLWWSIVSLLLAFIGMIVFFFYTLKANKWYTRLIFGAMLAIAGAEFCTNMYPAWQVPFGWLAVALMVWILIENQEWKQYKLLDWFIIVVDVVFMASIILRFFQVDADYIKAVTETVYPGKRISYGGYAMDKLFEYVPASINSIHELGNASEAGTFFATFPLGIILPFIVLKKENWKNSLLWCLLAPTAILLIYCTVGLPPIVAKLMLLTNSTPGRAVDVIGICAALLTVVSLSEMEDCGHVKWMWGILIAAVCGVSALVINYGVYKNNVFLIIVVVELITCAGIAIFVSDIKINIRKPLILIVSFLLMMDAVLIQPITVGLDAVYKKPLYSTVRNIIENSSEKTVWIGTDSLVNQNYLISCGAPTLNSTNYIPNKDVWKALDPNNEYEQIWNRYAHFNIVLSDVEQSNITLIAADLISVEMSVNDFEKLDVDYILSSVEAPSSYSKLLEEIYNVDGSIIYRVKK